jgi:hypothetical protein
MDEKSLSFVNQLIEKTEQGKLSWSTGFEDGQFKTLLPEGKLAFVVQVNGNTNRFMMLDDKQEVILQERIDLGELNRGIATPEAAERYGKRDALYHAILELNKLARTQALQVNEKLEKAEKLLAAI